MYFKENWQSMVEKEPAFGHVTMFQTSPSIHNRNQFQIFLNIDVCDILFFSVLREKDYPAVIFALRFTDDPLHSL